MSDESSIVALREVVRKAKAGGRAKARCGCGSLKGSMRTGGVATCQMTTPGEHVLHFDN
jgi:hypothetical protein